MLLAEMILAKDNIVLVFSECTIFVGEIYIVNLHTIGAPMKIYQWNLSCGKEHSFHLSFCFISTVK